MQTNQIVLCITILIVFVILISWILLQKRDEKYPLDDPLRGEYLPLRGASERYQPIEEKEEKKLYILPEERASDDIYINYLFPFSTIENLASFARTSKYGNYIVKKYFNKLGLPNNINTDQIINSIFLQGSDNNLRILENYFNLSADNSARLINIRGERYLQIRTDLLLPGEFQFTTVRDNGTITNRNKLKNISSNSPGLIVDSIYLYYANSGSMGIFVRLNRESSQFRPWLLSRAWTSGEENIPRGQYITLRAPYPRLGIDGRQINDLAGLKSRGEVVYLYSGNNILNHLYQKNIKIIQKEEKEEEGEEGEEGKDEEEVKDMRATREELLQFFQLLREGIPQPEKNDKLGIAISSLNPKFKNEILEIMLKIRDLINSSRSIFYKEYLTEALRKILNNPDLFTKSVINTLSSALV